MKEYFEVPLERVSRANVAVLAESYHDARAQIEVLLKSCSEPLTSNELKDKGVTQKRYSVGRSKLTALNWNRSHFRISRFEL